MSIYLDYAAATPVDPRVVEVMQPFLTDNFYNPSSIYKSARDVHHAVEAARHAVAKTIGSQKREIIFTAGGTEADNLAIHGVAKMFDDTHIVISTIEHPAITEAARNYDCTQVSVDNLGVINLAELENSITDKTILVSIGLANNEIGTIQPIKEVAAIIDKIRHHRKSIDNPRPLYLHTDASQAAGWLDLSVSRLGVDMMTLNGGKIYGPKQTGCLYIKSSIELKPLIDGGGHERGLRSGTENVPGVIGFAKALELISSDRKQSSSNVAELRNCLEKSLQAGLPSLIVNAQKARRLPNISSLCLQGYDGERLVMELDERGIQVATGAACSARSDEPSKTLIAIGLSFNQANSSLRLSLGVSTTRSDIAATISAIIEIATQ